jgi:hypothetical protein
MGGSDGGLGGREGRLRRQEDVFGAGKESCRLGGGEEGLASRAEMLISGKGGFGGRER